MSLGSVGNPSSFLARAIQTIRDVVYSVRSSTPLGKS
jgi:hypothetical protein